MPRATDDFSLVPSLGSFGLGVLPIVWLPGHGGTCGNGPRQSGQPTPSATPMSSATRASLAHVTLDDPAPCGLRRHRNPPHPYWATTDEAAAELGVTRSAVRQMMLADRLTYKTAANGRRYVRRHQLEVIANAGRRLHSIRQTAQPLEQHGSRAWSQGVSATLP